MFTVQNGQLEEPVVLDIHDSVPTTMTFRRHHHRHQNHHRPLLPTFVEAFKDPTVMGCPP